MFLAAGLALAAIILFAAFFVFRSHADASFVRITLEGGTYGTYRLEDDITLEIDSGNGTNKVVIKDGKVWMEDADCPDRYCVSKGGISHSGDTIVCLPHRLVIEILPSSDSDQDFDLIAQ